MIIRPASISIVLGLMSLCASARADTAVFWQHNPITPQAIASDPQLAGMQSWSLMTTIDTGRWSATGLRATLPQGLFLYNVPRTLGGGDTHPRLTAIELNPSLIYDTYVSAPRNQTGFDAPAILGPFPENEPPQSFGGPSDPTPGTFSVLWADPIGQPHPLGTFEVARLTFPAQVQPTIHPQSSAWYVIPDRMLPIPVILPEPAGVIALLILFAAPRRRPPRSCHVP